MLRVTLRDRYFTASYMSLLLGLAVTVSLAFLYQVVTGNAPIAVLLWALIPAAFWADLLIGRLKARNDGLQLLDFIREAVDAEDLAPELRPVGA